MSTTFSFKKLQPKGSLPDIDPAKYQVDEDLQSAVEVALALGQPLLITGEPGTGKTQLAHKIAYDLSQDADAHFLPEPLIFHTKTTSLASDLFYTYDAIRHFHDANLQKAANQQAPDIARYIELQALGKAIALSNKEEVQKKRYLQTEDGKPKSSVVLIDEIDKAPRDFPNDILNEIEYFRFAIKEDANYPIKRGSEQSVVVIMTSNSEKNLPEAFLRRVVFYHIPFPNQERLLAIVRNRLGQDSPYSDKAFIEHFVALREALKRKKAATAELITWLKILELHHFLEGDQVDFERLSPEQIRKLRFSYSVLAKTAEDLQLLKTRLHEQTESDKP